MDNIDNIENAENMDNQEQKESTVTSPSATRTTLASIISPEDNQEYSDEQFDNEYKTNDVVLEQPITEEEDDMYDFAGFGSNGSNGSSNLPTLPGMSSSSSTTTDSTSEDPMRSSSNDGGDSGIVPNERDAALKQEEDILLDTQQWHVHGQDYLERLYRYIELKGNTSEHSQMIFKMLTTQGIFEEKGIKRDEEDGNPLPLSVFVAIERNEQQHHTGTPPPQGASLESIQIYHKLLFDSINDALATIHEAFQYRTTSMTSSPWIRRHTGALSSKGRLPRSANELCTKLSKDVVKWDGVEQTPEVARESGTKYTLGTTLTETLTTDERLNAVLSSEVYDMEIEWRRQYEMVEASVKATVADQILIELLEDTARATQKVERQKEITKLKNSGR